MNVTNDVPASLRVWFVVHFFVDIVFALPLLFAPAWTLALFGFSVGETLTARLVGAALVGIGGASLVVRGKSREQFDALLTVKLLWSGSAIVGIVLTLIDGAPMSAWLFLAVFMFFFGLWGYYKTATTS